MNTNLNRIISDLKTFIENYEKAPGDIQKQAWTGTLIFLKKTLIDLKELEQELAKLV